MLEKLSKKYYLYFKLELIFYRISNSRNSNNLSESLPEMADSLCSTSKNISSIKRSVSSDKSKLYSI